MITVLLILTSFFLILTIKWAMNNDYKINELQKQLIANGKALYQTNKHNIELVDTVNKLTQTNINLNNKITDIETNAQQELQERFNNWTKKEAEKIRESAVKNTRAVLHGKSVEHLAPVLLQPFDQRDIKWSGDPIDYIVFHKANIIRDGKEDDIEIILVDIKTGQSSLNKVQRKIRDAVVAGRVSFLTFNPDEDKIVKWECHQTKKNGIQIPNQP